jgi:phage-related protein
LLKVCQLFFNQRDRLPGIVGPIIDQVTASIQTVTTIINEVVAGVKAAINGDWAGVWNSARLILAVQVGYIRSTFTRMSSVLGTIISAIYDAVVNTLKDLGIDIAPFLTTIETTWNNTWTALKSALTPITEGIEAIKTAISNFSTWLSGISLPNPFQPLMDAGKWVQDHLPGGQQPAAAGEDAASAGGTSYWPGGRTMINERGYEEVALPAGSRVYTNGQTNNLPRQNVTNVNVNMSGIQIKSDLDINLVGQRLGSLIAAQMGA